MKFLKKLFKRSSEDDDEDDYDDEDFDVGEDDDDGPSTVVIMDDDDDDDLEGEVASARDDGDEDVSIQDQQLAALEAQMAEDDDSLFGTGSQLDGDDGDDGPVGGQDEYNVEVDDDEDADGEFDYDEDDDDWDEDDEDGGRRKRGGRSKKLVFIAAGITVLALGIAGGAALWLMGDDKPQSAGVPLPEGAVQMALPPRSGSLNSVEEGSDRPLPTDQAAAEQPADQAAQGQAEGAPAPPAGGEAPNLMAQPGGLGGGGSLNQLAGATDGVQGLVVQSVTAASYRRVQDLERGVALAAAPDKALLEKISGVAKPLPKIDSRGRKPWEVYARPLTGSEQGQQVALMMVGLGLSRAATIAAIRKLPAEVSLVFEPYAPDLEDWLLRARLAGHEVFVSLPMESGRFPNEDAGPMALTTTVQVVDNLKRLHSVLASFGGYVGVVSTMGSKFNTADGQLKPVLQEIKNRGLMFVDATRGKSSAPTLAAEIDLPVVKNNVVLDDPPSSNLIQRKLRNLETFVSKNATAIALAHPYPVSIHQLQAWTKTLAEKKLVLVPVSALVGKQFIE